MGLRVLCHREEIVSQVDGFDAVVEVEEGFGEGGAEEEVAILAGDVHALVVVGVVVRSRIVFGDFDGAIFIFLLFGVGGVDAIDGVAEDESSVGDEF